MFVCFVGFFCFSLSFWFVLNLLKMVLTFPALPAGDVCSARGAGHLGDRFLIPRKNHDCANAARRCARSLWKRGAAQLL